MEPLTKPVDEQSIRDLLLRESLPAQAVERTWRALGHEDWQQADRALQRMAADPHVRLALADLAPELLDCARLSADPAMVLHNLERFVDASYNRLNLLRYLRTDPRAVAVLVALFAGSQFLSEVLVRNPEYFELLTSDQTLLEDSDRVQVHQRLSQALRAFSAVDSQANAMRRFQRLELLRTGVADLLGLIDLHAVVARLSDLADALVAECLQLAQTQAESGGGSAEGRLLVCAFGKLGGQELNYSSDIDLLLLRTEHCPESVAHRLTELLVRHLAQATSEGYLYRVDLRLRPYGRTGPPAPTLPSFLDYLRLRAALWEQQACLKLRPVAGEESLAAQVLPALEPLVYRERPAGRSRADIRAMKARIETQLLRRNEGTNVKLGVGGIRDIEFVVQYLQLEHGSRCPQVRQRTTLEALERLVAAGVAPEEDCERLRSAYIFLRTVEHRLQMMESRQVHSLPRDRAELRKLALRNGFADQALPAEEQFDRAYAHHTQAVREIFDRHLGAAA
jgi:glutamate-ammonia-ligase adenylyltransferase